MAVKIIRIYQLPTVANPKTELAGAVFEVEVLAGPVAGAYVNKKLTYEQFADLLGGANTGPNLRPDAFKLVRFLTKAESVAHFGGASLEGLPASGLCLGTTARVELYTEHDGVGAYEYNVEMVVVVGDATSPLRVFRDGDFLLNSADPDGLVPGKWVRADSLEAATAGIRRYAATINDWQADELMKIAFGASDSFFSAITAGGPFAAPAQAGVGTANWRPAAVPSPTTAGGAPQWVAGKQTAGALVYDLGITYRVKVDIANSQSAPGGNPNFYELVGASAAVQAQHTQQIAALQGTSAKVVLIDSSKALTGYDTLALAAASGKTSRASVFLNQASSGTGVTLTLGVFRGNGIYVEGTAASRFVLTASSMYEANIGYGVVAFNTAFNSIFGNCDLRGFMQGCILNDGNTVSSPNTLTLGPGTQTDANFFDTFTRNADGTYTTPQAGKVIDQRGAGVTTAQLEGVRATAALTPVQSANYTLQASDAGNIVPFSTGATCTIPADTFAVGTVLEIAQEGAAAVSLAGAAGVTLRTAGGLKTAGQWASLGLRQRAQNEWVVTNGVA
ncbi:hypothetical protein GO988_21510 [Hymenobacter sp. HMF4947]|uniref:Uncharacterized protein n=1 Tax=Hymenobacter ginkgonis TaxID=2682976 RepID=A0A7K1TKI4_9BACT|nr:hypothetical protein [Hymenobacter ginkgonis]MVN78915.1 hypothetical protein [Hymenobacter ginkgonis]